MFKLDSENAEEPEVKLPTQKVMYAKLSGLEEKKKFAARIAGIKGSEE